MISLDMELSIPPADGVLYEWQENDTIEAIANLFNADAQDILNWPGNHFDLVNPQVEAGALVLVPEGRREFRQWLAIQFCFVFFFFFFFFFLCFFKKKKKVFASLEYILLLGFLHHKYNHPNSLLVLVLVCNILFPWVWAVLGM